MSENPQGKITQKEWPREELRIDIAEVRAIERLLHAIADEPYEPHDPEQFAVQVEAISGLLTERLDRLEENFARFDVQEKRCATPGDPAVTVVE
jgi:hypothetical protein